MKKLLVVAGLFVIAIGAGAIVTSGASGWNPTGPECVGVDLTQHPDCTPPTTTGHTPVTFCHKPGTPAQQEITSDNEGFINGHLGHGDTLGPCPELPPPTTTTTPTDTTPTDTTPTETTPPLGTTTIQDSGPKPPVEAGTTPKAEKAAKRAQAVASSPGNESLQVAQLGG